MRMPQTPLSTTHYTRRCELYRAEPGFLLQGAMRAVVAPNKQCRAFPNGPKECTDSQVLP